MRRPRPGTRAPFLLAARPGSLPAQGHSPFFLPCPVPPLLPHTSTSNDSSPLLPSTATPTRCAGRAETPDRRNPRSLPHAPRAQRLPPAVPSEFGPRQPERPRLAAGTRASGLRSPNPRALEDRAPVRRGLRDARP